MRQNIEMLFNKEKYCIAEIQKNISAFLTTNNINTIGRGGNTLLLQAIALGNKKIVKSLIKKGADVNGNRKWYCYPLELACYYNDIEMISILQSTNQLKYDRKADASLPIAVARGSYEIVSFLLQKGTNPNQTYRKVPAVCWAVQEEYFSILQLLASYGASLDLRDEEMQSPLYTAVGVENIEIIDFLLEKQVPVEYETDTTPFMLACGNQNLDIAQKLLDAGADINHQDLEGRTALFYAKVFANTDVERFLVKHGAKMRLIDHHGICIKDLENQDVRKSIYDILNPED